MSDVRVLASALKHGCDAEDILCAWRMAFEEQLLQEEPRKTLRLGCDRALRVLEIVAVDGDNGQCVIIHEMPARTTYLRGVRRP